MERFKTISIAILALLGVIIILQNTAPVETRVLFLTITMPRAVLLLVTTLIGFGLGLLVSMHFQRQKKKKESP